MTGSHKRPPPPPLVLGTLRSLCLHNLRGPPHLLLHLHLPESARNQRTDL